MTYVFFGSPEFAASVLDVLIGAGRPPLAVVCNPDRPFGRNKIITPPAVKTLVLGLPENIKNKIKILQPEKLDSDFEDELKALGADCFVVAAYAKIIPKAILAIPAKGVLGVHPSLLPRYRGASPIQSALLHGEKETGITIYIVDEKVDHGAILKSASTPINEHDAYESLEEKLAHLGGVLLADVMPSYVSGKIMPKPQDESAATFTKKFTTEDGFISFVELKEGLRDSTKARVIYNKIRALSFEPGAWTLSADSPPKRIKILSAEIRNGLLFIHRIQFEGKNPLADEKLISRLLS